MKLIFILLFATILTQSSCDATASKTKTVTTSNSEKIDSTNAKEPETAVDTIIQDTLQVFKQTPEQKDTTLEKQEPKTERNSINIKDAVDVNKYRNVRDDPDYIGTPCKIVEGKCVRHNHKNEEELPKDLLDK